MFPDVECAHCGSPQQFEGFPSFSAFSPLLFLSALLVLAAPVRVRVVARRILIRLSPTTNDV